MLGDSFVRLTNRVPGWAASAFRSDSRLSRMVRPALNRLIPAREAEVSVRSGAGRGLVLPVMLGTEKYYWSGNHERHVQEAIVELLGPGMTFWDVGAHVGFFSMIAARQVGDRGRVVAFEPMPETRRRLERSIELNGFGNVTVCEFAIDGESGTRRLVPPGATAAAGTGADPEVFTPMWTLGEPGEDDLGIAVECRRLDDLGELSTPPDLLKIDAEGSETDVLAGGLGLLAEGGTKVIVEMSGRAELRRARSLIPGGSFELIGDNHWLVTL